MQKNKIGPQSHTIYKYQHKMIKDLNLRPDNANLLEENQGKTFFTLISALIFLDMTTKAEETNTKINK